MQWRFPILKVSFTNPDSVTDCDQYTHLLSNTLSIACSIRDVHHYPNFDPDDHSHTNHHTNIYHHAYANL
jgi:hypothetical protein